MTRTGDCLLWKFKWKEKVWICFSRTPLTGPSPGQPWLDPAGGVWPRPRWRFWGVLSEFLACPASCSTGCPLSELSSTIQRPSQIRVDIVVFRSAPLSCRAGARAAGTVLSAGSAVTADPVTVPGEAKRAQGATGHPGRPARPRGGSCHRSGSASRCGSGPGCASGCPAASRPSARPP